MWKAYSGWVRLNDFPGGGDKERGFPCVGNPLFLFITVLVRLLLKQCAGQLGEVTSLALDQVHVGEDVLSAHLVDHVDESVGLHIQVRGIDLLHVAAEYHLTALSCPRDDGLHLVRGQVLCLVGDEVGVAQAPTADEGQCLDDQLLALLHVIQELQFLAAWSELMFDDVQVIEQRLHVRSDLLLLVAWQEA